VLFKIERFGFDVDVFVVNFDGNLGCLKYFLRLFFCLESDEAVADWLVLGVDGQLAGVVVLPEKFFDCDVDFDEIDIFRDICQENRSLIEGGLLVLEVFVKGDRADGLAFKKKESELVCNILEFFFANFFVNLDDCLPSVF